MLAASQVLPLAVKFCRQIVPPVVATLIAAGLISAYNHAFSGHLQQPRMSALHAAENAAPQTAAVTTVGMTKPPPAPVTETITIYEEETAPERLWDKEANEQSGKDQTAIKLAEPAAAPIPAPVRAAQAPRIEPKYEPRPDVRYEPRAESRYEQRRVAAVELPPAVIRAPAPVIVAVPPSVVAPPAVAPVVAAMPVAQEQLPQYQQQQQPPYQQPPYQSQPQYQAQPQYPPPVTIGAQPVVTVPDKPVARPAEEAQSEPARPQGAIGTFVNVFKPSNWFARARQFGEKIEAAGNDILPNIRQ